METRRLAMVGGSCLAVPVPSHAGRAFWPSIVSGFLFLKKKIRPFMPTAGLAYHRRGLTQKHR